MNAAAFVLSTGRCGTQWLAKNLIDHYADLLAVTHEPYGHEYLPRRLLGIDDPAQWPTLALLDRHIAAIEHDLESKPYLECGWQCYGPLPYFAVRLAGRLRVVHLVRHPVPTAASLVTHLHYHPHHVEVTEKVMLMPSDAGVAMPEYRERWAAMSRFEKCLYFWAEITQLGLRYERELGVPWLRVRSEDMFAGPALDDLLDFIGMPRRDSIHAAREVRVDDYLMGTNVKLEADYQSIRRHPRIAAIAQEVGYDPFDFNTRQLAARYAFAPAPSLPSGIDWSSQWVNLPRNAPCPCGSGRKFKQCHGTLV